MADCWSCCPPFPAFLAAFFKAVFERGAGETPAVAIGLLGWPNKSNAAWEGGEIRFANEGRGRDEEGDEARDRVIYPPRVRFVKATNTSSYQRSV